MLRFTDRIILLIILALPIVNGNAQENDILTDSTKIEFELMPKSIRFGIDLVGVVKTFAKSGYSEFDITSDISIDRYFINFDYGLYKGERIADNIDYLTSGNYFRAGVDVNFLKKDPDGNAFFFGVKYARGTSDHSLLYNYDDPIFGEFSDTKNFNSVTSRWYELNTGIKVKIVGGIWLGFTGRMKFALKHDKSLDLQPYEIPGYGLADQKIMWGFDYYLFYRIPFGKKN